MMHIHIAKLFYSKSFSSKRFWFFINTTFLGCIANSMAVDLPIVVPFLIGNIAFSIIFLRLGFIWSVFSLILVTLPINSEIAWLGSSLQLLLMMLYNLNLKQYLSKTITTYALVISIIYQQLGYGIFVDSWDMFLCTIVLNTSIFALCTRTTLILNSISSSPKIQKTQSIKLQLTNRVALYSGVPGSIFIAFILQGTIGLHLSSQLHFFDQDQNSFVHKIEHYINLYINKNQMMASLDTKYLNKDTLMSLTEQHPKSISALITDKDGYIQHYYKAGIIDNDVSNILVNDRSYFLKPKELHSSYISEVFQGRTLGQDLLFAVSTPLMKNGQFEGVLEQSIDLSALTNLLVPSENLALNSLLLDSESKKIWGSNLLGKLGEEWSEHLNLESYTPSFYRKILLTQPEKITFTDDFSFIVLQKNLEDLRWSTQYYLEVKPYAIRYFIYLSLAMMLALMLMEYISILSGRFIHNYTCTLEAIADQAHNWNLETPNYKPLQFKQSSAEFEMLSHSIDTMQKRVLLSRKALMNSMKEIIVMNDDLEEKVSARTKELERERDKANQLTAIKTRFLANMSHEIRTPITIIKGFTEELLTTTTGENNKTLQRINNNTLHLQQLINDILDTAKIDEGKMTINMENILIKAFITEIVDDTVILAQQKNLQFDCNISAPESLIICADSFRLRQILLNLLSNAIKFTNTGTITVEAFMIDNNMLKINIRDQGIGISKIQQTSLFSAFSQGDSSISRDFGGTGLGLYITKNLADAMEIDLSLISELGKGTVFSLILATKQITPAFTSTSLSTVQPTIENLKSLSGKLLIVDDVKDIRLLLASYLKNTQVHLLFGNNGQQALDIALTECPDVIIMDQQMPVMDGLTTALKLRKCGFNTPIISLSADIFENTNNPHLSPFNAELTKPINKSKLLTLLSALLPHIENSKDLSTQEQPSLDNNLKSEDEDEQLRQDYLISLHSIPDEIEQILQSMNIDNLLNLLHKIKGTSACLNLMELSNSAHKAEVAIKENKALNEVCTLFMTSLTDTKIKHNVL
ncbi:ATP-binding protein [Shewanella frigidimarina]|uniref:ATP-binding protein n=2 Tax=Shewanella TaxID=22 RepID=UPI000F4D7843|nr:ATP-binding protein [Shewanella frigidimarina]RPA31315.1 response regulator [Shewanella frigidimarina]